MALALAVVGIIMMTNLVFPGGGSLSAYAAASTETQLQNTRRYYTPSRRLRMLRRHSPNRTITYCDTHYRK